MKIAKKVFRILGTILLIFLICVVILMFNARMSGEAPSVFGYQVFRVSSGSMEPTLMIGDVILVKDTPPQEIEKGDIITYLGKEDDFAGKFITHMVIEDPQLSGGDYMFQTRGISEDVLKDDPVVYEEQVLGVYVCTIPFVDKVYSFFLQPYGLITFILIIVVLFAYELISLIVSYKTLDEIDDIIPDDDTTGDDESDKSETKEENTDKKNE